MKTPRIYLADLPASVNGCAAPDADAGYIVLINSALDDYNKKLALLHELAHIAAGDLESTGSAQAIEERTHAATEQAAQTMRNPWGCSKSAKRNH